MEMMDRISPKKGDIRLGRYVVQHAGVASAI